MCILVVRCDCAKTIDDACLGKEDSLVKTSFIPALVAVSWMGLLADRQAAAQYGAPSSVPRYVATAQAVPHPQATNTGVPAQNGGAATATDPAIDASTNDWLGVDNGLWDGAPVEAFCAKCGGGGAPPDWYTMQGVRIMSRSSPRKVPISFQAPKNGVYQAVLINDGSGDYHVRNLDVTTSASVVNSAGTAYVGNPYQALNTKQMGLDVAANYAFTVGHYFCRDKNNNDHFVELTFWGLNSWSNEKSLNGYLVPVYDQNTTYSTDVATAINNGTIIPDTESDFFVGSLRTPFPTARELPTMSDPQKTLSIAFNYGTQQWTTYKSSMNNLEVNGRFTPRGQPDRLVLHPNGKWQRECQPGTYMSYLYGFRFMEIDETFGFHSYGLGQWGDEYTSAPQHASGDYWIEARNSLVGLQVGVDMTFRKCRWAWGFESKLGPCLNFSNQISNIEATILDGQAHDDADYNRRLAARKCEAAMIGEVGFQATYKFRPNLMGRAAYDFMWISGLALAPEQLQFVSDPVNRINVNGTAFSHGLSLGMEWLW